MQYQDKQENIVRRTRIQDYEISKLVNAIEKKNISTANFLYNSDIINIDKIKLMTKMINSFS